MSNKQENKRTQEDVCRELLIDVHNDMEKKGYLAEEAAGHYGDCLDTMAAQLQLQVLDLDTDDELLLLCHDAESMLEEAIDMNDLHTVITKAEITVEDVIDLKDNHEYSHEEIRKIINLAEELKPYLPARG